MLAQERCALCGDSPVVESHLIPDFAVRRLKRDSPTPFLRAFNPNLRVQGAKSIPLLCRKCDNERFSDAETAFAQGVFHPVLDRKNIEFQCIEAYRYFAASIAWRSIAFRLRERHQPDFVYTTADIAAMEYADVMLRHYLLGEIEYPTDIEQHIFFAGTKGVGPFPGINAYLTMANDAQIVGTSEKLYAYTILCGVLLVCPLRLPADERDKWRGGGTLIVPGTVMRAHSQTMEDGDLGGIIASFAGQLHKERDAMSPRQRAIVRKSLQGIDLKAIAETPHGQALLQDHVNERNMRDE